MSAPATPGAAVPSLWQPYTHRSHPEAERAGKESLAWLGSFDIAWQPGHFDTIRSENAGYWWNLFDPGAKDYERYRLGVDFISALYPFDDTYSGPYACASPAEAVAWAGQWMRLLDDPRFAVRCGHPFSAPLIDVMRRAAAMATPVQYRRFADAVKAYVTSLAWEFAGQDRSVRQRVAEAAACRFYTSGCTGIVGILHVSHDLDISDETFHHPLWRAYTEAAVLILALYNDLYSYAREQADTPDDVNILAAAVAEGRGDLRRGLGRVVTLHNQAMERVVHLGARLKKHHPAQARAYTQAIEEMLAGNLVFGRTATRYHGGEPALPPYTLTTTPPPTIGTIEIPTFAWWWDTGRAAPRTG
ncbi:hypothetical protein OG730_00110 [Streptomyces sp. NBC_01298]|uniref:terpene synthase family protein n=1 Tax=Streptomyces sp. NBC_01298 TaxID=2903817 RepID=UPI002E0D43B9|nr:hypothetical protein OG730_00110 [Streptomyces sp. NBC_01298]